MAVVTDSTADLPMELAERLGLRVVPMTVAFGDESFISGVTLQTDEFYERLAESDELPTTSQPVAAWFEEAYGDAGDEGAEAVVSIHLSSELSGTYELACVAGRDAPVPVTCVDSRQVGGSLALAVLAAQRAADDGAGAHDVADTARRIAEQTRLSFAVDTLDYLRKGGRLTGAQAVVGSVLRVKPILAIEEGRVVPLDKVRTWSRAIDRLAELAARHADDREVDVVVTHAVAPERAGELWSVLDERLDVRERLETVIGPVVGSHIGPGAVGVAVAPAV